jgi:hypothetical protein
MATSMLAELQRIQGLPVSELQTEWTRLYDGEPCRSRNRQFLVRRLCWRAQELRLGGLSHDARARLLELTPDRFTRRSIPSSFDPAIVVTPRPKPVAANREDRLPAAGSVIIRRWRDRDLRLLVREDGGFELDGKVYGSLSEAARAATGSRWNGWLFWGVKPRRRR